MLRAVIVIILSCICFTANADTVTQFSDAFSGPNIYSPATIYDYQQGNYKMWYGGWQDPSQRRDHIYYRTSGDGVNWSSGYIEVLTPEIVAQKYQNSTGQLVNIIHVNDPSVTKHLNVASNTYLYTMFFTVCYAPCTQGSDNSIWSMISGDGISWELPKPLNISLPSRVNGAQNPSIIIDNSNPYQVFWHVYFSVSNDVGSNVYLVYANGNRDTQSAAFSVLSPGRSVQNPHVMIVGSTWYVMFNAGNSVSGYDIYYSTSSTNNWSGSSLLVGNNGNPFCATVTPGGQPKDSTHYLLYFSTILRGSNGSCDFANNRTISVRTFSR